MSRNTWHFCAMLCCCFSLLLIQLLWPVQASQPVAIDAKWLDALTARNIGPANMSGRIVQIVGVESDPKAVYVAAASGGLWKTADGGDTWKSVFDKGTSVCIGDVAVSLSNPNVVWVGTGEHNARNSVSWGDGVYKSTDGGKSWQHMGLNDSHTIGRIAIHPTNPDIVYVAALGHLWGPNKERGVFKTTDGGKTWQISKFIDEDTGFVDLKMDPSDPETLYAAAYRTRRDAFSSSLEPVVFHIGDKAGLYKTSDGGKIWQHLQVAAPNSKYGRCGIDIYRKDPNIIYAVVQTDKTPVGINKGGPTNGKGGPEVGGVYRSDDKGKTWTHLNTVCPRPFYYGQIRVDPKDDKRVYVLGNNTSLSNDGGKAFGGGAGSVHADHHAMWINPHNPNEIWLGTDGGFGISTNRGQSYRAIRAMALAQYYGISVDMGKPYYVYGGLQDNGCWGGPSATYEAGGIAPNKWFSVPAGGDGFHTQCDPSDPNTVYAESQWGGLVRTSVAGKGGKGKGEPGGATTTTGGGKGGIKPQVSGIRFNWSTPILLSPHDPKTLFCGGQFLVVSNQRGDNWKRISPNLAYGPDAGPTPDYGHTLFTVGESPKKKGVIWTGSDDGRIHVAKDGGEKWTDVSKIHGMPKDSCISRVEPSHFDEATCYVSITRYRNDDRKPYVFKTTDHGTSWQNITSNLPADGSVHVVVQSSKNKNLLFCGTEFGVFASLDDGKSWQRLKAGMPTVAVHDLVIHPRERDLVVGTHGRGIYIIDDISPLEQLTPQLVGKAWHLFPVRPAVAFKMKAGAATAKSNVFVGENPPYGAIIQYYVEKPAPIPRNVTIIIVDAKGKQLASLPVTSAAGLHRVVWNLREAGGQIEIVPPGEYTAILEVLPGDKKEQQKFRVVAE